MANLNTLNNIINRFIGALKSRKKSAYFGIFLNAIRPFTIQIDKFIPVNNVRNNNIIPPVLMIISSPRSGSTIIYQVLTRVIPSTYISNLHFLFPRNASRYLHKNNLFGMNLTGFQNYYGYTGKWNDVNEGNEIIAAFFKDGGQLNTIRNNFLKFIQLIAINNNIPLIIKNVRAYKNIHDLHQAIPELLFLRIKRNTDMVIASELKAHRELGSFHPIPPALENSRIADPLEFCVHQILEIEREIERQKKEINQKMWLEWHYEDFCLKPLEYIEILVKYYLKMDPKVIRKDALAEKLTPSLNSNLSNEEKRRIALLINQYTHNHLNHLQL